MKLQNSMRRRFFVDEIRGGLAEIDGDDAHHLTRVLRIEAGQRYEISDNRSVYLAQVEMAHKKRVVFRTLEKMETRPIPVHISVCAALIKFDHFEWMIEKATELGAAEIVPVETIRVEKGLDRAAEKRIDRWRKIALEASQQSRRDFLPEVVEPIKFDECLERAATCRLALDEDVFARPLGAVLPSLRSSDDNVALLIGPEGGWTNEEREQFTAAGWVPASLGPLILRAETAAIAALAVINSAWFA